MSLSCLPLFDTDETTTTAIRFIFCLNGHFVGLGLIPKGELWVFLKPGVITVAHSTAIKLKWKIVIESLLLA